MKTKSYPSVKKLTRTEGRRLFERQVRKSLDISAEEFVRRWESGDLKESENSDVMRLAMLIPLGR